MKINIVIGTMILLLGILFLVSPKAFSAEAEGKTAPLGMVLIPKGPFTMGSTQKDIQ